MKVPKQSLGHNFIPKRELGSELKGFRIISAWDKNKIEMRNIKS